MFYWIDWEFWSWKTSLAVYFSKKINKDKNAIILSNIKLDPELFPNYFFFDDQELLTMFRTDNFINDLERIIYQKKWKWSLPKRQRNKFTDTYIFFDESNAVLNNREWKNFDKAFKYYLNQPRKNFEEIYLIWADWDSNEKSFKKFVKWWFYVLPLFDLPYLKNIWIVRRRQKDDFWNTKELAYKTKNDYWIIVTEYIPVDVYHEWFYKPLVWDYYDDLHKNIPDEKKLQINYKFLDKYLKIKPEFKKVIKEHYPEIHKKIN